MSTDAAISSASLTVEPPARELAVERDFWRNALAGMTFESVWALGMSFAISSVLIPAYLGELGTPRSVIGIAASIKTLCVPLQLFSQHLIGGPRRKRRMWMMYTIQASSFIVMGLVAMALPAEPVGWRIGSFLLLITAFFVCDALATPMYYSILTDNCPVRRRGRLYGYRSVALGVVGLAGLYPARWILGHFEGAHAYHVAVTIAGSIFTVAALSTLAIRDHIDPTRQASGGELRARPTARALFRDTWGSLRQLWLGPNYRIFTFFVVILWGSVSIGPFLITYARDVLGHAGDLTSRFQFVYLATAVVNGIWIGLVADRWGYQVTLICQAFIAVIAFSLVQVWGESNGVLLAYALWTALHLGLSVSMVNFSVELIPTMSPAHLMAAGNLFSLPVSVLLPWACGSIIDLSRAAGGSIAWGYIVVLTIGAVLAVIGGFGIAMLVKEPRRGRLYVIKTLDRA